jgi:D-3-phosphoglycerate dehydrogenase / 2-oxoglutarate reductase
MFRILVSDRLGDAGLERLAEAGDVYFDHRPGLDRSQLLNDIVDYDALIVRSSTKVDAEVLAAGVRLKVVGRAGIGVDNIDVREATLRGIIVMNTPQANAIATAEQAICHMLAVSRHTATAHASLLAGEWRRGDFVGHQLYRRKLGIVGFGRIGRLVASRAQSLGMEVWAHDPFVSEDVARELGVALVDLDELLAESDYITLHTVITPETESLINAESLARMKPEAVLINTARGRLVDEHALADALRSGRLRAAAVDVYSAEPPSGNPLIGLPNVLHTPHLGASTVEAQRDVATQIVDQVLAALRGTDFRNTVNMPFHAGPDFETTQPYMELAEKLGRLHAAMAPAPIRRVELEVRGETAERLVRPVAAALLKGLLEKSLADPVNYINAPILAEESGISVSQTKGMDVVDFANVISCRVSWDGGQRTLAGALFGGKAQRIVQIEDYFLDANPHGIVLLMRNQDVPGVIGQAGTILASHNINIGEWRMGRYQPGSEALSFINLDQEPPTEVLSALAGIPAVTAVRLVVF